MANDSLVPYQQALPEVTDSPEAILSKAFVVWETRGRGWSLFDFPVELEPPFLPLYYLLSIPETPVFDDGRKKTFWSDLFSSPTDNSAAVTSYRKQVSDYQLVIAEASEPFYCQYYNAEFVELQIILPKDLKLSKGAAENLLLSFSHLSHPVSFEVIGSNQEIIIQFVLTEKDRLQVRQQLKAHLPTCVIRETSDYLSELWINGESNPLIVDFGLSNDFFYPLKTNSSFDADYLITAIGALSNLKEDEIGILQILFQKTRNDWGTEIIESVGYLEETGQLPKNALHFAKEKTRSPLFAVSLRVAGRSFHEERTWQIVKGLGAGLVSFSDPAGNELIPLSNDDYPEEYHEQGLLNRQSFRSGMLLNLEELAGVVHLPSPMVQSDKLQREIEQTKSAPNLALHHALVLGENSHQSETREVTLSNDQRSRHLHVLGSSGSGKSMFLLNLIKQDLENNQGLCVIDPHGDLIDDVISNIPDSRLNDVILFDPSDAEFPIGFNILQANSELEKNLLSSDLVATFRRMSTSWGDVMDSVLANAILAFVESEKGGTLFDLKRFLVEKDFRSEFLKTVSDEAIRYFWQNEFPLIHGKPQSSILIRLDAFLRQKLIRNIVCQRENKIDFRAVMDRQKVLLIKLSQGLIGEENACLLGTLLVSKLYQTALSRQDTNSRPFFSCYLDEFHHFITPSMENILSGVRKYNLGLVLAHQEFRQLQSRNAEVASSVLSNCYTRICFRLGDTDAEKFASGFSFFDAKSLQNLGIGEAIARIERAEFDFNLTTDLLPKVSKEAVEQRRTVVTQQSRKTYGTAKNEVETNFIPARVNEVGAISPPEVARTAATKPKSPPPRHKETTENFIEKPPTPPESQITTSGFMDFPVQLENVSHKGNQQHLYLQSLVKRIAESKGFRVTLEKEIFGGVGRIDVALENDAERIAVEISVTNAPDYEVQNIRKCLAAGFETVVMISTDAKHLANIRKKAEMIISETQLSKVYFLEPDNFHLFLESQSKYQTQSQNKIKGYKVNISFKETSEDEASSRKQTVLEILSSVIGRKGKK